MSLKDNVRKVGLWLSSGYLFFNVLAAGSRFLGSSPQPGENALKAASGAALLVSVVGTIKDSVLDPEREFYKKERDVSLTEKSFLLGGMSPATHATLLYGAFNTGLIEQDGQRVKPKPENWDASAPLGDKAFGAKFVPTAINDDAPFEIIDSIRDPQQGGLGAVAYREKETGNIHVFVVGLETDVAGRDALPDVKSVALDGMRTQIRALNKFVDSVVKDHGEIASLTGQSMGTIPAAVVAYERGVRYIGVEPRMNSTLAGQLFGSRQVADFREWYQDQANTVAIEVGANAWNRYRVTSLGETPPWNAGTVLAVTDNGKVAQGALFVGMGIGGPGATHPASNSVRSLALENPNTGLIQVNLETLPTKAAEVLRSRGPGDIVVAGFAGVALAATTGFGLAAAGTALWGLFQRQGRQ
ncbi:MAG: hypothetical protein ACK59C_07340 [Holosporales bacterium]|jgi:hypothetical protein